MTCVSLHTPTHIPAHTHLTCHIDICLTSKLLCRRLLAFAGSARLFLLIMTWICHHGDSWDTKCLLRDVKLASVFLSVLGGPSRWLSSHCDCCCKSHKSEHEGESGTSFNELSTSCSETQSEASSPQGTVICGPIIRRPNAHTLDRPVPKGPVHMLQQAEMRRKTDMLRVRTFGVRDREAAKRKANKEKMTPEQELEKCIQDFRRIRIPDRFPERKNMWQSELLRKYHLWSRQQGRC